MVGVTTRLGGGTCGKKNNGTHLLPTQLLLPSQSREPQTALEIVCMVEPINPLCFRARACVLTNSRGQGRVSDVDVGWEGDVNGA
jgi:hypothetical protein